MNRQILAGIASVGLCFAATASAQLASAQGREPTVDERYRDTNVQPVEQQVPRLIAPQQGQSRLAHELPAPAKNAKAKTPAAFLGVTFGDNERAPIVRTVAAGSPAEQAGLQPNDLIETLQGKPIRTNDDVLNIVSKMRPGDVLEIGFSRRMTIRTQAPLASAPAMTAHTAGYAPQLPVSTYAAPEDPAPPKQSRIEAPNNQRRNDNQRNGNQSNERGGILGRLLRGR
jgi:membrane-associated protease RseP (regulator of RpoE activity)